LGAFEARIVKFLTIPGQHSAGPPDQDHCDIGGRRNKNDLIGLKTLIYQPWFEDTRN